MDCRWFYFDFCRAMTFWIFAEDILLIYLSYRWCERLSWRSVSRWKSKEAMSFGEFCQAMRVTCSLDFSFQSPTN